MKIALGDKSNKFLRGQLYSRSHSGKKRCIIVGNIKKSTLHQFCFKCVSDLIDLDLDLPGSFVRYFEFLPSTIMKTGVNCNHQSLFNDVIQLPAMKSTLDLTVVDNYQVEQDTIFVLHWRY